MPFYTAGNIPPELLRVQIEAIAAELLPAWDAATAFFKGAGREQAGQPFQLYLAGGAARKIAVQHFFGAVRGQLYRNPSDIDFKIIRPEVLQTEESFKKNAELFFRELHAAVSVSSGTNLSFTLEQTPAWLLSKGIAQSKKSVDLALSYGDVAAAMPGTARMLINAVTGDILFLNLKTYEQFLALELEHLGLEEIINSELDPSPYEKECARLLSVKKNYAGNWLEDWDNVNNPKYITQQRKAWLGNVLYCTRLMIECGFHIGPEMAQIFEKVLLDPKKSKDCLAAYNSVAIKKAYKIITKLESVLSPVAKLQIDKTTSPHTLPVLSSSSSGSEQDSLASSITSPRESSSSSDVSGDVPVLLALDLGMTQTLTPTPIAVAPVTYVDVVKNKASPMPAVGMTKNTRLSPMDASSSGLSLQPTAKKNKKPIASAKSNHQLRPLQVQTASASKPPVIFDKPKEVLELPEIQPEIYVAPDPVDARSNKRNKKQNKKAIIYEAAVVDLSAPQFTGDFNAFVKELDVFIAAVHRLSNPWEQNKLLISSLKGIADAIQVEHVSLNILNKFGAVLNHPLWSEHHIELIDAKKFISAHKAEGTKKPQQNTHIVASEATQQVQHAPEPTEMVSASDSSSTTQPEATQNASAPVPPMMPIAPPPRVIAENSVMTQLKSPLLFCGLAPSLGYLLVRTAVMSAPQAALMLTLMSMTSVGVEYLLRKEKSRARALDQLAFEQAKTTLETDPSWDKEQFIAVITSLRKIPHRDINFLTGDHPKTNFLRRVISIYQVLARYTHKLDLNDNGRNILDAIEKCYGSLQQAASAPYLFLAESAHNNPTASAEEAQRIELNNFFVDFKVVSKKEEDYIKKLSLILHNWPIQCFYSLAYHHNKIVLIDRAATAHNMHASYLPAEKNNAKSPAMTSSKKLSK